MRKKFDVCVVGGCSIDMMVYNTDVKKTEIFFGGKGANQAIAAARAGVKTCIVTKLGNDSYTKLIVKNLKKNGVKVFVDIEKDGENDISKIIISNGDNKIERFGNMTSYFNEKFIEKYKNILLSSKFVVIQNKTSQNFTRALIEFCFENGIKVVLTPTKPTEISVSDKKNLKLLEKVTYICANESETKTMFNCEKVEQAIEKFPNQLITTLGSKGVIYNDGQKNKFIPSIKIENVVDTTGAGDTFCGNFLANLIEGKSFDDAVNLAQFASAYKIQYKSAQEGMPTKKNLKKFIETLS